MNHLPTFHSSNKTAALYLSFMVTHNPAPSFLPYLTSYLRTEVLQEKKQGYKQSLSDFKSVIAGKEEQNLILYLYVCYDAEATSLASVSLTV